MTHALFRRREQPVGWSLRTEGRGIGVGRRELLSDIVRMGVGEEDGKERERETERGRRESIRCACEGEGGLMIV
jgi:hypothetical protein